VYERIGFEMIDKCKKIIYWKIINTLI
jgi:hypothetical protein